MRKSFSFSVSILFPAEAGSPQWRVNLAPAAPSRRWPLVRQRVVSEVSPEESSKNGRLFAKRLRIYLTHVQRNVKKLKKTTAQQNSGSRGNSRNVFLMEPLASLDPFPEEIIAQSQILGDLGLF